QRGRLNHHSNRITGTSSRQGAPQLKEPEMNSIRFEKPLYLERHERRKEGTLLRYLKTKAIPEERSGLHS
ncbi:MAG: hypothetical protein KC584_06335, partial [Nitrospira sp.]|nr:hypothetical protein [Nitrospira sp.]